MLPQIHTQRMYKQVRKQRALVTGLGILMKNSNNIKWGVSTADTLMLRALQTHRVTRHTHYSGTVQPLSVMMMAALTRHWLLKSPPPANTALGRGKKNKKKKTWGVAVSRHVISWEVYLPLNVTGHLASPPPAGRPSSFCSDHFIRGCAPERHRLRYQCRGIPTVLQHNVQM